MLGTFDKALSLLYCRAPKGADRFYSLVQNDFYDGSPPHTRLFLLSLTLSP